MNIYIQYANVFKALGDPKRAMIVDIFPAANSAYTRF